jgi:hypothetical protein
MSLQKERDRELADALTAMNNAKPEAYEQARIHYYTLKEGQGWLRGEKERLANAEVDPFLKQLTDQYEASKSTWTPSDQSNEVGDEAETRYLHRRLLEEKDKVGVARRLVTFGSQVVPNTSWLPYILDFFIALLGIACVYLLSSGKGSKIWGLFRPTQTTNTI